MEVADRSPALPAAKQYVADAGTGRGLMLLDAMAAAWGVEAGPLGKVVWFDVAPPLPPDGAAEAPGAAANLAWPELDACPDSDWPDIGAAPDAARPPMELVHVSLLAVPLPLLKRVSEQYDTLFRELRLILEHADAEEHPIPRRLINLGDELTSQYSSFTMSSDAELRAAMDRGDETIDLEFDLPPDIGPATRHYDDLLDEADRWCRAGRELLTLAPKPEAVALRKWLLLEFVRQVDGHPAVPWPECTWAARLT